MNRINFKIAIPTFLILVLSTSLFGQAASEPIAHDSSLLAFLFEHIVLIMGIIVFLAAMLAIYNMSSKLIELQRLRTLAEMGIASHEEVIEVVNQSSWSRMMTWLGGLKPIAKEASLDLGHEYDGIRELDNRLPPWWLGLMYGSMIFAVVYMWYYHWSGNDWSSEQEYALAMAEGNDIKEAYLFKMANAVNENNVELLTDEAAVAKGRDIYMLNCVACHGPQGQGGVGPNFADSYWIHGGDIKDVFRTIKYGVPEKGMISWKEQLPPLAMQQVASFIKSFEGTSPPNPKAPEGKLEE